MDLLPEELPFEPQLFTADAARDASLVRRLRVLLHTFPLFQMRAADARRDEELRHYDTLALALKVLDVIAERMGMEDEADREIIDFALRPLLEAMDKAARTFPDRRRHEAITDRVLGALRNDQEGRRPFKIPYTELQPNGRVAVRKLEFRLVQDAFSLMGGTVLRLTNEAVNLFFNALELDIEDAQAATEAIVHSQLARGRFDEALRSAHYALRQSRLYRDRLSRLLRDTQRDIGRVDWREEAPRLIDDAMKHLEARLDTERGILESTHERLDHLPAGTSEAEAVARISDVMQQCIDTHTTLQRELMSARTTFLDSQARQSFLPAVVQARPELLHEVLTPLLAQGTKQVMDILERTVPLLLAPKPQAMPSLLFLFDGLLRPRRQPRTEWIHIEPIDPERSLRDVARYGDSERAAAELILRALAPRTALSDLLLDLRHANTAPSVIEVVVLLALQHFDIEGLEHPIVKAEIRARHGLQDADFFGDDLWLSPLPPTTTDEASAAP